MSVPSSIVILIFINMGKIGQGILGGLSGKVGNIIGASWKGINYIRIKPTSVANPRTPGQVNQRNKFTAALEFLQPNKQFINIGYKSLAIKKSAFNAAMSSVLTSGITGVAPNFTVDYPNVLISKGDLKVALNPSFVATTPGQVSFGWDDNSTEVNANITDKAMLLVYNSTKKESIYLSDGTIREDGNQEVYIPASYTGDTIHMFMAFVTEGGSQVSNSSYLGSGTAA
jgi:uncharacterized protein DUF6266